MTAAKNLQELERRAALELECLAYPSRTWVTPRRHGDQPVYDVLIVGGGQSGITIAFHLLRERVTNIRVLDRNPEGREGPWITFRAHAHAAHAEGSHRPGAWHSEPFGAGLVRSELRRELLGQSRQNSARAIWHDYIGWLRRTVGIDVTHEVEVKDIEPIANGLSRSPRWSVQSRKRYMPAMSFSQPAWKVPDAGSCRTSSDARCRATVMRIRRKDRFCRAWRHVGSPSLAPARPPSIMARPRLNTVPHPLTFTVAGPSCRHQSKPVDRIRRASFAILAISTTP